NPLPPEQGTVVVHPDGQFAYSPPPPTAVVPFTGTVSFSYRAYDGLMYSAAKTVNITVTETSPHANPDTYTVAHDQTLTAFVSVLANDTDPDASVANEPLTALLAWYPTHGRIAFSSDGTFVYTPNPGF